MKNSWYQFNPLEYTLGGGVLIGGVCGAIHYLIALTRVSSFFSLSPYFLFFLFLVCGGCAAGMGLILRLYQGGRPLFLLSAALLLLFQMIYSLATGDVFHDERVFWITSWALPLTMMLSNTPKFKNLCSKGNMGHDDEQASELPPDLYKPAPAWLVISFLMAGTILGLSFGFMT